MAFGRLVGAKLAAPAPRAARGRLIRVVDATTVRMAWRNGRWLNQQGEAFDFRAAFKAAPEGGGFC